MASQRAPLFSEGCPPKRRSREGDILRSDRDSSRYYTGLTGDVSARLAAHNDGMSVHTAQNKPWRVTVAMEFSTERAARRFEFYLKSGSGRRLCLALPGLLGEQIVLCSDVE